VVIFFTPVDWYGIKSLLRRFWRQAEDHFSTSLCHSLLSHSIEELYGSGDNIEIINKNKI
jgi:hypothetical protein